MVEAGTPREEAVPALLEEHGARIHALATRLCGDAGQAEDLVQEVFLQAWKDWQAFEGRAAPATWLWRIAARTCQRLQRRRAGEPSHLQPLDEALPFAAGHLGDARAGAGGGPAAEAIRRESVARLERAVVVLPEDFRMPLVLKDVLGFPVAEVATILGLKAATVKTRLHRARLQLRAALDAALPERELPEAAYSRQVCLDLLAAKQEALDRGVGTTPELDAATCDRCQAVFASLDLAQGLCARLGEGSLPAELREKILGTFR